MADPLSAAASGIAVGTLVVQVGQCILKLKDCWRQIQEGPGSIKLQLRQLEQLYQILRSIEDGQAQSQSLSLPADSLDMCREGADELSSLVDELARRLQEKKNWSNKRALLQVILKKDEMKRLKERLNEAIQLLQLACCCRTNALLQRNTAMLERTQAMVQMQPHIILTELTKTLATSTNLRAPQNSEQHLKYLGRETCIGLDSNPFAFLFGSLQVQTKLYKRKSKTREETLARYKLPTWFSNCVLYISTHKSLSGWQFNLMSYRIISDDSAFSQCIRAGDIGGVQKMLAERTGFVTDRLSRYNETPLHIAAETGNFEMCKLLLYEGADVLAFDHLDQTPLQCMMNHGGLLAATQGINTTNICRLFIESGAADLLIEDISILGAFKGYTAGLKYLQQQVFPPYFETHLEEKFNNAYKVAHQGWVNGPELLKMTLSTGRITKEITTYTDRRGNTVLHLITPGIVNSHLNSPYSRQYDFVDEEPDCRRPDEANSINGWRLLAQEIITTGVAVSAVDKNNRTFLQSLLIMFGMYWIPHWRNRAWPGRSGWWNALMALLNNWLVDLESCALDLSSYGKEEWNQHFLYPVEFEIELFMGGPCPKIRLVNFSYGHRPEDWIFWVSEPTDEFAGNFWGMVENVSTEDSDRELHNQILSTPGAWNSDDDDDEYDNEDDDEDKNRNILIGVIT